MYASSSSNFLRDGVSTIGGIPIVEDVREPLDRIQFKNANDVLLSEIVNLAIPVGFDSGGDAGQPKTGT